MTQEQDATKKSTTSSDKKHATLVNWEMRWIPNETENNFYRLVGQTINHRDWDDWTFVSTSQLLRIDFEKGEAETRNTIYKLENVKDEE